MTSRELTDWLRTQSAGESAEELPDEAGTPIGRRVVHILGKRRTDLTEDDLRVMRKVVETVRFERGWNQDTAAGAPDWRHRLMSLGHAPLKPH